ncbi:hypothetical protein J41TS2_31900 [Bacillus sonorensis]|nr:hypothetical protein J41TS2_31900 [Bacillus sonorensis]
MPAAAMHPGISKISSAISLPILESPCHLFTFIVYLKKKFVKKGKRDNIDIVQIVANEYLSVQNFSYKGVKG